MDEVQRLYDRIIEETIHRVGAKGLLKSENPLLLGKLKTMWSEAVNQKIKESVENARYSSSSGACTSNLDPIKTTHSYQNSTGNSNIHSIKNVNTQLSPDVARNLDVARQYVHRTIPTSCLSLFSHSRPSQPTHVITCSYYTRSSCAPNKHSVDSSQARLVLDDFSFFYWIWPICLPSSCQSSAWSSVVSWLARCSTLSTLCVLIAMKLK
eukprot:GDKK01004880.1.p1 GENE.GDKK01004880.1~~GDKK01004880.1.p1  ORF type:complete len:220 (+),score=18.58 GDKK01004880.1:32-661(+)